MKFTNMQLFEEVCSRRMSPETAADIMMQNDREQTWLWKLRKWLGIEPHYAQPVQCSFCKRWRDQKELGPGLPLWTGMGAGAVFCPRCAPVTVPWSNEKMPPGHLL